MDEFRFNVVDLQPLKNQFDHNTYGLSSSTLVLRRGQAFQIKLNFDGRPFEPRKDKLVLVVTLDSPSVEVPVSVSAQSGQPSTTNWSGRLDDEQNVPRTISVSLLSPASASVGVYTLGLRVETSTGVKNHTLGQFTLLCNPWCQGDSVFLNSEELRNEYVRSDIGLLFKGTADYPEPRNWSFDLYKKGILDICMKLLQLSPEHIMNPSKDLKDRTNPVYISRLISAMINCDDGDRGVLMACQSSECNDGINPSNWPGSAAILWKWSESEFRPVKYGQCWVFAAVMCTVMRALGIPTRVVTNYNSAHDTNGNMVIEEHYSERGEKLSLCKDSIWNFHVWVESWMKRPDLGQEFDGWQVLDPTPQERSGGRFRCGPASVKAIREKKFEAQYDVPFVYSEVNADVCTMIVRDGKILSSMIDTNRVGTLICTKRPGLKQMLNITSHYKSETDEKPISSHVLCSTGKKPVQSPVSCSTASKCGERASSIPNCIAVSLDLLDRLVVGQNVLFKFTIANNFSKDKKLKVHINAQYKEYYRNPTGTFWDTFEELTIGPYATKTFEYKITFSEYGNKVAKENFMMNLALVIEDEETGDRILASEEFNVTSIHPQYTPSIQAK